MDGIFLALFLFLDTGILPEWVDKCILNGIFCGLPHAVRKEESFNRLSFLFLLPEIPVRVPAFMRLDRKLPEIPGAKKKGGMNYERSECVCGWISNAFP